MAQTGRILAAVSIAAVLWTGGFAGVAAEGPHQSNSPTRFQVSPQPKGGNADSVAALSADQWSEDLDFLSRELPVRYGGEVPSTGWQTFHGAAAELDAKLPMLSSTAIVAGLMRLVAAFDEETTTIWPFQPAVGFRILPVQAYWFDDGVYITRADEEFGHTVGSRLARIGGHDVDAVFNAFKPLISAENDYHKKWWFFVYGFCPELLHVLGFSDNPDTARLTLVDENGVVYEVDVTGFPFPAYAKRFFTTPVDNEFSPVITNRRARNYWFGVLPDERTLYIQLNEIRNQPKGESIEAFVARLVAFADTVEFDRTVVDMRRRGGGSGHLAVPLADAIGRHGKINRRDRLFALIGRSTSGAALELASMLEYRTRTTFVGEPTGEGPNGVGDSKTFTLPNSKIEVYYTDRFWPTSIPEDGRRWITPDVKAGYSHTDFFDGNDPVLAAAERYRTRPVVEGRIDPDAARRIAGRYLFSPYQILRIDFDSGGGALSFVVTDFIETSFFEVRSDLRPITTYRFGTDVEGLTIDAVPAREGSVEQLFIDWKGHAKTVGRAPDGFRLPVELIRDDRIEAGVTALLADEENRWYYRMTVGWFLDDVGHRLLEADRVDEAVLVFGANTEFYPDDVDAWRGLAKGCLAGGDLPRTKTCYEKILELDPDNEEATAILERLERSRAR